MMLSMIFALICAFFLLTGGIGALIAHIILRRRGTRVFRRFVLIPVVALVLGGLVLIYPIYWLSVIRAGNGGFDNPGNLSQPAYFDEDYNITIGDKLYIEFGDLSGLAEQSDTPVAGLRDPEYESGVMDGLFGDVSTSPLYAVTNGAGCDMITDGYYLYCDEAQLQRAKAYYDDLRNFTFRLAGEDEWYETETEALPVVNIDGTQLNGLGALKSGTALELRRETGNQQIVYLVAVSSDGATKKDIEFLKQEELLYLVYTESYEHNETAYVCYRLPEDLNTYLLSALF